MIKRTRISISFLLNVNRILGSKLHISNDCNVIRKFFSLDRYTSSLSEAPRSYLSEGKLKSLPPAERNMVFAEEFKTF
jgi:hypothetical protein